jgi:uncharacterized membrane protein
MKNPWTYYILAMILFILGFIDLAFLKYSGHDTNGVVVTIWGVACLLWGVRLEFVSRRS